MLERIKELESQIDLHEKQLKFKQNKLESLHPKLNQILDVSIFKVVINKIWLHE